MCCTYAKQNPQGMCRPKNSMVQKFRLPVAITEILDLPCCVTWYLCSNTHVLFLSGRSGDNCEITNVCLTRDNPCVNGQCIATGE